MDKKKVKPKKKVKISKEKKEQIENKLINPEVSTQEEIKKKYKLNPFRVLAHSFILVIFFSSAILVLFTTKESTQDAVFKHNLQSLIKQYKTSGPSVELYRSLFNLYQDKDKTIAYLYLKDAYKLLKNNKSEISKNIDIVKYLFENSFKNNEDVNNILEYSIILFKYTNPSNPEYFKNLQVLVSLYSILGNYSQAEKLLTSYEEIYNKNLEIKYALTKFYLDQKKYEKAYDKIFTVIKYKESNKLQFNKNDVILYYQVLVNLNKKEEAKNYLISSVKSLSSSDLKEVLDYIVVNYDFEGNGFQDFKNLINKISLIRSEINAYLNMDPYLNLEIGRKLYLTKDKKALAEIYFNKSLNTSPDSLKKLISDYIYNIKQEEAKKQNLDDNKSIGTDLIKKIR
ncbi:MAG: tetratricopeptide repeat protein [bacterium]|nr:tetratricopeptide repeat protein [bacterium]